MQRNKVEPPLNSHSIQELEDLTLKILSRNPFDLPVSKIGPALPPAYRRLKKHLPAVLGDLLARERLYSWQPPQGKAKSPPHSVYSTEPLARVVAQRTVELLKPKAMTLPELKKHFPTPIKTHVMLFLEPLLKDKVVKRHPPSGKTKKFGLQDPDPLEFLGSEIKKLFDKGTRLGFADADIADAVQRHGKPLVEKHAPTLSLSQIENAVFKAMTALKPSASQGALVYIPDLRDALRGIFPEKESFDRAIMELAKAEKVQLQSHSLPDTLSEEQKAAMIENLRGGYFMAIGKRME
jgi:hypothetical protein